MLDCDSKVAPGWAQVRYQQAEMLLNTTLPKQSVAWVLPANVSRRTLIASVKSGMSSACGRQQRARFTCMAAGDSFNSDTPPDRGKGLISELLSGKDNPDGIHWTQATVIENM